MIYRNNYQQIGAVRTVAHQWVLATGYRWNAVSGAVRLCILKDHLQKTDSDLPGYQKIGRVGEYAI